MMVRYGLAALLAATVAAPGCAAAPAARASGAQGFYLTTDVLTRPNQLPSAQAYAVPGVTGVFIRIPWNVIQPAADRYDWQLFDAVARKAIASGKKLSIGIVTGRSTPLWLKDRGVAFQEFQVGNNCAPAQMPAVWQPAYADAYVAMMRGVRDHLAQIGAADAVEIVKISGIAQHTLELRQPYGNKCASDTDARMAQFGYRPSRVLAAWDRIATGMAALFPKALLVQPILQAQGFPAIDDGGRPIPMGQVTIGDQILADCTKRLGARCGVQWNALNFNGPMAPRVLAARDRGATIGWQSNLFEGLRGGAGCQTDRRAATIPCTPATYTELLKRGVALGATFIEVWESDVLRYPQAFAAANAGWRS